MWVAFLTKQLLIGNEANHNHLIYYYLFNLYNPNPKRCLWDNNLNESYTVWKKLNKYIGYYVFIVTTCNPSEEC